MDQELDPPVLVMASCALSTTMRRWERVLAAALCTRESSASTTTEPAVGMVKVTVMGSPGRLHQLLQLEVVL